MCGYGLSTIRPLMANLNLGLQMNLNERLCHRDASNNILLNRLLGQ